MRNSNFELLRLVAMFFIVFYHLLLFFITDIDAAPIYRALWMPLHVAVIIFVLISGYFHITPSLRGIVKLTVPLVIFYLPLTILELTRGIGGIKDLFFFTKSPYWFIRIYLCLFLLAPLLNAYLISNRRRLYLLAVLGFVSVYMGTLHEPSLHDGKNLPLFMFLYVLGDYLKANKSIYEKLRLYRLALIWLTYNIAMVWVYTIFHNTIIGRLLWILNFPYCSPLLIINAALLFVIFAKINLKSKFINWLSSSTLSIYVIHHQHYVLYSIIGMAVLWGYRILQSPLTILLYIGIVTSLIMMWCILIDKLITPPPYCDLQFVFQTRQSSE